MSKNGRRPDSVGPSTCRQHTTNAALHNTECPDAAFGSLTPPSCGDSVCEAPQVLAAASECAWLQKEGGSCPRFALPGPGAGMCHRRYANLSGYAETYSNRQNNDTAYAYDDTVDAYTNITQFETHAGNSGGPVWYYGSDGKPA